MKTIGVILGIIIWLVIYASLTSFIALDTKNATTWQGVYMFFNCIVASYLAIDIAYKFVKWFFRHLH